MYTRASLTDILARKSARVSVKSADKSASIVVRVRRTRPLPREDHRAELGEDVRVGVGVGPMEFKLKQTNRQTDTTDC